MIASPYDKVIFKYMLSYGSNTMQGLSLPIGSKVLHVATQYGYPYLWALINPHETHMEYVTIRCYGTGVHISAIDDIGEHIGTILTDGDNYVWHFFMQRNTGIK